MSAETKFAEKHPKINALIGGANNMSNIIECVICKSMASAEENNEYSAEFYNCPVCGRFQLVADNNSLNINWNYLASYLFYHKYPASEEDNYKYNTTMDKDDCEKYNREFISGNNVCGRPVHMDREMIEAWYPRSISERVDYILLHIAGMTKHIGEKIYCTIDELISLLFVDRYELQTNSLGNNKILRNIEKDCTGEIEYMLNYLKQAGYIEYVLPPLISGKATIQLKPNGYKRVDELQKYISHGRNVLVAMKFGEETRMLREAIRKGISDAGYIAIFIDEVQHNDFITPELLKYIRDSKFLVVDLTHLNNGAYFEEGYAMGLGKPVIQLCKSGTKLHFDVAQKNTLMWNTESDIASMLTNRIKATIG